MEYSLHDLEIMTGYSARRLRQFMKDGILKGTYQKAKWTFTNEQFAEFIENPYIRDGLLIKQRAEVLHFLEDTSNNMEEACMVYDVENNALFCEKIKDRIINEYEQENENMGRFTYFYDDNKNKGRFTFFGTIEQIAYFVDIIRSVK